MRTRILPALAALLLPPLSLVLARSGVGRILPAITGVIGAALFFFLWTGPGLLLWLAAGLAAAVLIGRKR